ncbi:MAG: hypothetical protein IPG04_32365 [Polyangiaceae bacterium]|jgi:hypothetical protein|nr:hypothetical protein [Polyangiaceae bacterium]
MTQDLFQHPGNFEQGELTGNVRLGKFEAHYEELFAEALEDGVITSEERARLERAADSFGLDRERVLSLEKALLAAWEARHRIAINEVPGQGEEVSAPPAAGASAEVLQARVAELEARVRFLEAELADARSHIPVDVDFSELRESTAIEATDPEEIFPRVRQDPRDITSVRALFRATRVTDPDRAYRAARVLGFLGAQSEEEAAFAKAREPDGLPKPTASLTAEAWRRNLFHPDEEVLTGDIFAVITSPVLLGRVTALRRQNALPKLEPSALQDPQTSTVQAVRCFGWSASILGMRPPPLYVDPTWEGVAEMVPGVPPATRLGRRALSGRSPTELAFIAARHLASYREDHFIRLLFPSIPDLEDIFLAALTLSQPQIPLSEQVRKRAAPIAAAIDPLLDPSQRDRLRGHFLRFIEEGGRTNLQRWATAADLTALRAGLLLSDDLGAAQRVLGLYGEIEADAKLDDLIVFYLSDRCSRLRRQIGTAQDQAAS